MLGIDSSGTGRCTHQRLGRRRRRRSARGRRQGFSGCFCCGLAWSIVAEHITDYSNENGCFPLCEKCWRGMTIEERIPFYERLVREWVRTGSVSPSDAGDKLAKILAAVRAGA